MSKKKWHEACCPFPGSRVSKSLAFLVSAASDPHVMFGCVWLRIPTAIGRVPYTPVAAQGSWQNVS